MHVKMNGLEKLLARIVSLAIGQGLLAEYWLAIHKK